MAESLYGKQGRSGAVLTVTAPAGAHVTAAKDGKTYARTADDAGTVQFKGLSTGRWIVTISDGTQQNNQAVQITADYEVSLTFFTGTIVVNYPAGSTCTCTKGDTVLTAADTSGRYSFTVPEAGDWTVSCTDGVSSNSNVVSIVLKGQTQTVTLSYTQTVFDNGDQCEEVTGGWWRNTAVSYGPNNSYPNDGNVHIGTSIGCVSFSSYSACAWTKELIDVTAYSTIRITAGEVHTGSSRDFCLVPANAESVEASNAACVKLTASQESALDISALSGSYYFVVTAVDGKYTTVNKIVME